MNNADNPAMPLTGNAYEDFAGYDGTKNTSCNPDCQGLTKRETFAMNAPGMPSWFEELHKPEFISPCDVLSQEESDDYAEYCSDNFGYLRFEEGGAASKKYSEILSNHYFNHNTNVFFKWRTYYADSLLTQLEKGNESTGVDL